MTFDDTAEILSLRRLKSDADVCHSFSGADDDFFSTEVVQDPESASSVRNLGIMRVGNAARQGDAQHYTPIVAAVTAGVASRCYDSRIMADGRRPDKIAIVSRASASIYRILQHDNSAMLADAPDSGFSVASERCL